MATHGESMLSTTSKMVLMLLPLMMIVGPKSELYKVKKKSDNVIA